MLLGNFVFTALSVEKILFVLKFPFCFLLLFFFSSDYLHDVEKFIVQSKVASPQTLFHVSFLVYKIVDSFNFSKVSLQFHFFLKNPVQIIYITLVILL